jgi:calcium-dependent protein kinase
VKLATMKSSSRQVAIKITSNKDREAQREVELLTFLGADHENICNLVDFYPKGKELYMIFEYCTGGDIMDLVHDNDRLTESEGANVARCICSALAYCHTKNIAHRDIKGENVLCFRATEISPLRCKLADWGCATYFASYEETFSQKIGSSCYMAPEVVKECYLPAKADIWSLGATVWTVLHGEPPFRGPTHDITFQRMLTETLLLPKSISVGTSTCCQHFILSTMNRRAWKRPLADTLLNHPWLQELGDDDSYPEMEVPEQMDPKSIPDDEVLRMPQG